MWRGGMADSRLGKSKWIRFLLENKCWQCYQIRRDCRQNYIICWNFSKTTWFINTAFSPKSQKSDKKSQLRPQRKQQQRQIWPHFPVHPILKSRICIVVQCWSTHLLENTQWRKVKQMQPVWICLCVIQALWVNIWKCTLEKVKQMQSMLLCIL